jgi:rubrerythrin
VLIFEDIDKRKQTVSLSTAIERLQAPEIGHITFGEREVRKIRSISELRNRITHSEYDLNPQSAEAQFFGVFAFVSYLQALHLKTEIDAILSATAVERLMTIKHAVDAISEKAMLRIKEEGRDGKWVWVCPQCGAETFVVEDGIDTCYTCRHQEATMECPECHKILFEEELVNISGEFDMDDEGGHYFVVDDFGYGGKERVCPECAKKIMVLRRL